MSSVMPPLAAELTPLKASLTVQHRALDEFLGVLRQAQASQSSRTTLSSGRVSVHPYAKATKSFDEEGTARKKRRGDAGTKSPSSRSMLKRDNCRRLERNPVERGDLRGSGRPRGANFSKHAPPSSHSRMQQGLDQALPNDAESSSAHPLSYRDSANGGLCWYISRLASPSMPTATT
ncbi:hypothetical protein OH76DRAFT_1545030 [Lentinus brumalis]|uniref:Uncharacterized protein n=1 Tax=Lentinus brumalis TaxID=2498619 RepID=A0A371CSL4_9APHY|nr:hypothetical protein OH76DRAFT_1545030 [Polyporus brumalis]